MEGLNFKDIFVYIHSRFKVSLGCMRPVQKERKVEGGEGGREGEREGREGERGRGRTSPEAELQAVVNHLMWELGSELRSSARVASALYYQVISQGHVYRDSFYYPHYEQHTVNTQAARSLCVLRNVCTFLGVAEVPGFSPLFLYQIQIVSK